MGFNDPNDFIGSTFFKPKEHQNDLALLIEPKRIDRDQENTYRGKTTLRDEVTADISVFANQKALEDQEPTSILKGAKVVHGMLAGTLEKIIGEASVFVVDMAQTENGEGYVFRAPEAEAITAVKNYYDARESAKDDAPGFDED